MKILVLSSIFTSVIVIFMEEDFSEEKNKKKRKEEDLIFRKSLLKGYTKKIANDNIKLRENIKSMAKNFLRKNGNNDQKSSG